MNKLTKQMIEELVGKIIAFAKDHELGNDFSVFYNGKMQTMDYSDGWNKGKWVTKENVNPLDYSEYFPEKFILGMAYDGIFYEFINGYGYQGELTYSLFEELFEEYGLYFEHLDSCHLTVGLAGDMEVEYTEFKKKEIKYLYRPEDAPSTVISQIMDTWRELSKKVGDVGSCVLGAYLEFEYQGNTYRMYPQSPYQGSMSWESPLDTIKSMLGKQGCTKIHYIPGFLD